MGLKLKNMNTVKSKDGTSIAYDKTGNGPALIVFDGAFCSRNFGPMPRLAPLLARHFTVYAYDRRARGDSGDTKPYAIEREIEDLQAMIQEAGGSAFVFSISSGAILALHAAGKKLNIKKLAIYEPPFFVEKAAKKLPADHYSHLTQLIAGGQRSKAVKYFMTKVMGMPAVIPFVMQFLPMWPKMKANAPSLPYDAAVVGDGSLPTGMLRSITIPILVAGGDKSPKILQDAVKAVAETVPGAQLIMLKGQTHNVSAKVLAPELEKFFLAEELETAGIP